MTCNAETLRYWLDVHNVVAVGSQFVLDHDGAVRIFCIHEDRYVHLVREVQPWEKDYVLAFTEAVARASTIFICATCFDAVH